MKRDDFETLVHSPSDLNADYLRWAEYNAAHEGVTWEVDGIDDKVIPLRDGQLGIIVGRPGHGKSSLLVRLARIEAQKIRERDKEEEECVVFCTWEESAEEVTQMLLADPDSDYTITDLAWGRVDVDEIKRQVVKQSGFPPIYVIGHGIMRAQDGHRAPVMYPDNVLKAIEKMSSQHGGLKPTLLCFDYIQRIPIRDLSNKVEETMEAVKQIGDLAKRIGAPAYVAAQAKQGVDHRDNKVPIASDCQWSCLAGDARIMNRETGWLINARELWKRQPSPDNPFPIHSLNEGDLQIEGGEIVAAKRNPPEPIYKLKCANTSTVRTNARHRFYTPNGWTERQDLNVGDWVALAGELPCDIGDQLERYAESALLWRKITHIERDGAEHTYDFYAPPLENFVTNGFVTHNSSIEQDADKVISCMRPIKYKPRGDIYEFPDGRAYAVNEDLMILRMGKQRGDRGVHTWPCYFNPATLKLGVLRR